MSTASHLETLRLMPAPASGERTAALFLSGDEPAAWLAEICAWSLGGVEAELKLYVVPRSGTDRRALVGQRAQRQVERFQAGKDRRAGNSGGDLVLKLTVAQAQVLQLRESFARQHRLQVTQSDVAAVVVAAEPDFQVFQPGQVFHDGFPQHAHVQTARLDDERLQLGVVDFTEFEAVGTTHTEVF